LVQVLVVFVGELEIQGCPVLSHMRLIAGLGENDDAFLSEQPRQRKLRRTDPVSGRDRLEPAVPRQLALIERRIGHDRQTTHPTPRQQVPFNAAVAEIVEHLVGDDVLAAGKPSCFLHVRDLEIADAVVVDLPGTLEGLKRIKRFL
jgi:hypothetical protein